jgi:subfamily B ATP-binding cassette protein MsbA
MGFTWFKISALADVIEPAFEILAAAILVLILYTSFQESRNFPTLLVFIFILYRLYPQFAELSENRNALIAKSASVDQVIRFLNVNDKLSIHSGSVLCSGMQEAIRFESVSFRYKCSDAFALQKISIRILKNQTTAIVGPSGSGKSTFINLLLRLYEPTEGSIFVDDTALPQFDLVSWRCRIGVVTQDVYLFNTTVQQNIAYGRMHATEEEIIAAAHQADAHDFICALPQGYQTIIGDRGVRLSAGQKQRIALARALVRDPEILILDEAMNALDSVSERVIQTSLQQFRHNRTVIVITHHFSAIEQADHIVVLEAGRVVEQGRPQQLLNNAALFAQLHDLQSLTLQRHLPGTFRFKAPWGRFRPFI